jgi:cytochrome c peroxidase
VSGPARIAGELGWPDTSGAVAGNKKHYDSSRRSCALSRRGGALSKTRVAAAALLAVLFVHAIMCAIAAVGSAPAFGLPAEVALGERLFLETRFSQPFSAHQRASGSGASLADAETSTDPASPPRDLRAISCRTCHLVDELQNAQHGGVRSYTDFSARSPIPARGDGVSTTVRNSPTMVDATVPRHVPLMLHYDGEFASREDLVVATLTGRNLGWLAAEQEIAVAQIAAVIREDDGQGDLARLYGAISYRQALDGAAAGIPPQFRLERRFRLDTAAASDRQILDAVARLIAAYMDSLRFSTDASGHYSGSPYDVFLARNQLPQAPAPGESDPAYGRRLRALLDALAAPRFVSNLDGRFRLHAQDFRFGPRELAGLKIFLTQSAGAGGAGNCVSCHPPPHFTDFRFHNTGVSQLEYDAIHGPGAFEKLWIPDLARRNADPQRFLPSSPAHPSASGPYRSAPAAGRPELADLGVWNVLGNPDLPAPQRALREILCAQFRVERCSAAALLPRTAAMFKTPTLRDLGQSGPYLHTGSMASIEAVLNFYPLASTMARRGRLRNADPELSRIRLREVDITPLAAFLKSLNEDYYREVRGARNLAARRLLWYGPQSATPGLIAALSRLEVQVTTVSSSERGGGRGGERKLRLGGDRFQRTSREPLGAARGGAQIAQHPRRDSNSGFQRRSLRATTRERCGAVRPDAGLRARRADLGSYRRARRALTPMRK